ncbi:hypothetical protein [Pseudomonas sp. YuFO8]|uniref:hypothetical protein n=1 Tax=Pseudomonas sp. YuFO8 TaxID=3095361 RepID=UPI002B24938F|nr:hypothetical protein [Pseudomonas sp. YuFO8]MEB2622088.1 hypothetical protein [Pseudomonas sp. YuFO8]
MELSAMAVSVLLMLTELILTGVVGFQMYLFKQISAARREHLEFRIEVAERYVRAEHIDKAMEKLEDRLEQRLQHLFNQPPQRKRT